MINKKKYKLLNDALNGLTNNIFNLLILKGSAGLGKSFNVTKYLDDNKIDYTLIDSYTTPLKFYQLLYENRNKKIIVFDDLEGISDNKIKSMLKSACWNIYKDRNVSYFSTTTRLEGIPSSFEIKANIILICNKIPKGFEAVINRGEKIDFFFSISEKIEIFEEIMRLDPEKIDIEVLDYIKQTCNESTKNLSIRTLEILSSYKKAGSEWKLHAEEMLKTDERLKMVMDGLSEEDFCERTGNHRATYYRLKNKIIPESKIKQAEVMVTKQKKHKGEIVIDMGNYSCDGQGFVKGQKYIGVSFNGHNEGSSSTFLTEEEAQKHIKFLIDKHSLAYNIKINDMRQEIRA